MEEYALIRSIDGKDRFLRDLFGEDCYTDDVSNALFMERQEAEKHKLEEDVLIRIFWDDQGDIEYWERVGRGGNRGMSVHDLKILPEYFAPVAEGSKTFEVRKNDRGFAVGDRLILREWKPEPKTYTGGEIEAVVTYILDNEQYLQPGYVVLGIKVWEALWA